MNIDDVSASGSERAYDTLGEGAFAIGTGRVAIPLAEAGVDVTGIELSHAMIDRLREKDVGDRIPVVQGDMSMVSARTGYSLVILVYNTISNLLTQDEQVQCFTNAAQHLLPGGGFVIELWIPQPQVPGTANQAAVEGNESGYLLMDTYDTVTQRSVLHHIRFSPALDGGHEAEIVRTPQRYIWLSELDLMAQFARFRLEQRWADWDRNEFTASSPSRISVYRLDS